MSRVWVFLGLMIMGLPCCSDVAGPHALRGGIEAGGVPPTQNDVDRFGPPDLVVPLEVGKITRVRLAVPSVNSDSDDKSWDLAFQERQIYTNSGLSGAGAAGVFGPLALSVWDSASPPEVPHLQVDRAVGAFDGWFLYDGAPNHALWSRYHIYGIRDGEYLWKLQIIGYYGERFGAPTSAVYKLRYAQIGPDASSDVHEVASLDATSGGLSAPRSAPSGCLDLVNGRSVAVLPDEANQRHDYQLCFRRSVISVRAPSESHAGVKAVDMDQPTTHSETLRVVQARSAETECQRFERVVAADFDSLHFDGDRVQSGLGDGWLEQGVEGWKPTSAVWVVQGADGRQRYLVRFLSYTAPVEQTGGSVGIQVRKI